MSKYKLLVIADIPLAMSGVGNQTKYIVDHLVKTGKYSITYFGGAVKHQKYDPFRVEEWGEDVLIVPVDGYGNPDMIRQCLDLQRPDCIWIMTDPRYYDWLFAMSDEINQVCPIVYWNLWDNADKETWPRYNSRFYDACYSLPAINKLTYNFLKENGWEDKVSYIPHGVPEDDFKILPKEERMKLRTGFFGESIDEMKDKFIVFYNSRNAMRKRTGTVIMAFKEFLNRLPEEEREKCTLAMKTPPKDREGQNLFAIVKDFNLDGRVAIADSVFPNQTMAEFYNMSDVTISLSSEEGFGLCVLESLMCGTPVICTKTGGMQDQIIDPNTGDVFGYALEPAARSLIGSQTTPYIWSDHVNHFEAADCLMEIYQYKKSGKDHKEHFAGEKARRSMLERFSLIDMQTKMEEVIENSILNWREEKENKKVNILEV